MLRAALSRTPVASCAAHGAGCANQWRNVCLVGRQSIAQPCEEEQHSSATIRPPPRNTCAQDMVIGRRSLAQRVAHTSSNWSGSGCAYLDEAAATIGATVDRNKFRRSKAAAAARGTGGGREVVRREAALLELGLGLCNQVLRIRTPQNPPQVLNTLSLVSVRESRIQYLCDPQWFRDTASRGPTTIVAPESQFRTYPSDHGKSV
ncbi:acyl-CoA-binding domain-containing protein 4-like [Dorcoceras hygrometricum]|uniref:Acyl-CoA-binding domain-containing protein 4-like n=1 Tax=Dorcoceras hygrometricum TaxID=472368 RepID=A0A2Z7BQL3_9LAMI|nr:acyl-CoA-binding domain-containing protein 4-like [Dorcoceras hygrometricum]